MSINANRLTRPAYFVFAILCSLFILNLAAPEQPTHASSAPSEKPASSAPQTFTPPPLSFPVVPLYGTGPTSPVTVADLNGDSNPDVVATVSNATGTVLKLLKGNGDGTFQAPADLNAGLGAGDVAVGDYNGDNEPDLAVTMGGIPGASGINILLGNGDGSFQAPTNLDTGSNFMLITAIDLNNDGRLDLVSNYYNPANYIRLGLKVFLGNGDGTFQVPKVISLDSASKVAVGDFNGDGKPDLVVTRVNYTDPNVAVLLGNGDGTFQAPVSYGGYAEFVAVADMNADGKLDIVASSPGYVLLGNGDGTFKPLIQYSDGSRYCQGLVIQDFNGDGKLDVATNVDFGGIANISVSLGNGDGTFQPPLNFDTGLYLYFVTGGDLNKDGKYDLVVASRDYGVLVFLNNGDGTFPATRAFKVSLDPSTGATGDLNADGKLDIVTGNSNSKDVSVLINSGNGRFNPVVNYPVGIVPDFLVVADFDDDKALDIITASYGSSSLKLLKGNGDGTFQLAVTITAGSNIQGIAGADLNGDSRADLLLAIGNSTSILLLSGRSDGTFEAPVTLSSGGNPCSLAVGDFNNDKIPDIGATNCSNSSVSVLLGKGAGTFDTAKTTFTTGNPGKIALTDLNNDGWLDVAFIDTGNNVSELFGKGDGAFQPGFNNVIGGAARFVFGDFNGDDLPDLAVTDTSPSINVLVNNGDGTFQAPVNYKVGQMYDKALLAADLNGDRKTDLAVVNTGLPDVISYNGYVSVLFATSNKATAKVEQNSSANPAYSGQNITLTATVSAAASGKGTPSGTVTFKDGTATLGTSSLTNGVTTFSTSSLAAGSHSITAEYSGDAGFNPVVSSALIQIVDSSTLVKVIEDDGLADTPYTFSFALSQANTGPIKTVVIDSSVSAVNVAGNPLLTVGAGVKIEGRCSPNGNGPLVTITGARLALNGGIILEGLELRGTQVQLRTAPGVSANRLTCVKVSHNP